MTKIDDGGSAFPHQEKDAQGMHYYTHPGMTLRDYFAGQALPLLATMPDAARDLSGALGISIEDSVATLAYSIADAMIVQRGQGASS